jgi:uncharacterized ion transporter superfamily protein YfcC
MSIFSSKKKQSKTVLAPNPIIIISCIILISAIASYIIPAGLYDRVEDAGTGRMVVDPSLPLPVVFRVEAVSLHSYLL